MNTVALLNIDSILLWAAGFLVFHVDDGYPDFLHVWISRAVTHSLLPSRLAHFLLVDAYTMCVVWTRSLFERAIWAPIPDALAVVPTGSPYPRCPHIQVLAELVVLCGRQVRHLFEGRFVIDWQLRHLRQRGFCRLLPPQSVDHILTCLIVTRECRLLLFYLLLCCVLLCRVVLRHVVCCL